MNPYEVLGVSQNATDEEIKKAYMNLVKQYHPDKYQDNPLSGLAEEKLQEINQAYDMLKNKKGSFSKGNSRSSYSYTNSSQNSDYSSDVSNFSQIRMHIDRNNIYEAEKMLNQTSMRNAEWFFLSGMVSYKKGWYDDALAKINQATSLDPSNFEYQDAKNRLQGMGMGYQNRAAGFRQSSTSDAFCQALQCYICMDCLCDSF